MITFEPLNSEINGIYSDKDNMITPRHNYLTGSRHYALATLEQIIGNLNRKKVDDNMIRFLNGSLIELVKDGEEKYYEVIKEIHAIFGDKSVNVNSILEQVKKHFSHNVLSIPEKTVLKEICDMNLNEYLFKSDYEKCDFNAMKTLSTLAYQIIVQRLHKHINSIEVLVTTDGEISSWSYDYCEEKNKHIWIEWTPLDKIDHFYSIYEVHCCGLKEDSMLDLATADAVEQQFTDEDKKIMSYNMLVKQYCGVIEQEVNEIIQLKNLSNKPNNHLMWKRMKEYVRQNNIELVSGVFTLYDVLDDLYDLRNLSVDCQVNLTPFL